MSNRAQTPADSAVTAADIHLTDTTSTGIQRRLEPQARFGDCLGRGHGTPRKNPTMYCAPQQTLYCPRQTALLAPVANQTYNTITNGRCTHQYAGCTQVQRVTSAPVKTVDRGCPPLSDLEPPRSASMYLPNPTRPNPRRHQLPPAPRTVVHIDLLWRRGRLGSSAHDLVAAMWTLPARASCTAPYTSLVNFTLLHGD